MDRFTRFKLLRALWARAKNLLAWLYGPRAREERLRAQTWQQINLAQRWQQINVTERHIRDGMIRGTGDPDSAVRPQASDPSTDAVRASQAHTHHAWQAQVEAQRAWYLAAQRAEQQRRHNGKR
jgi:hypothetical protein